MTPAEVLELEDGASVIHTVFGRGIVISTSEYAGYGEIVIRFLDLQSPYDLKQMDAEFCAHALTREWP